MSQAPRRGRRRLLVMLGLVALAIAAGLIVSARRPPPRVPTVVEALERGAFVREVTGTGVVEALQERALGFASAGTVATVAVDEGERVAAGEVLARLDTAATERELASTRTSLASASADRTSVLAQQEADRFDAASAVSAAEEQRARAERSLIDAERERETVQRLFDVGAASRNELRAAQDAALRARSALTEAERALTTARSREANLASVAAAQRAGADARVAQLESQLANLEARLAEATLVSPIDGVVTGVQIQVGAAVATQSVITVADTTRLRVRGRFDESRALELAQGQLAVIVPDADARLRLDARVDRISPVAARDAGVAQVSAELSFADGQTLDPAVVRPGYTVTVRVRVRELEDVLLMPLEAITEGPDGSFVVRVMAHEPDGGSAEHVPLTVLERNPTLAAVEGALSAGDLIAVVGLDAIADGAPVSFPRLPGRSGGGD